MCQRLVGCFRRLLGPAAVLAVASWIPSSASAWWQTGHHVIAVLAYELLPESDQERLIAILQSHPRFAEDFGAPESIQGDDRAVARWQIGAAGYWPDVARDFPAWNRPTWHYQLAATTTIGDPEKVELPETPRGLPVGADLDTQELYIAQAIELCRGVLADRDRDDADRAIAICWLLHLIADGHQPCHAGSLYAESVLPDGDRGANRIEVFEHGNMHAIWDSLLGSEATPNDVRRRVAELKADEALMANSLAIAEERTETMDWLEESRELAVRYVYAPDVIRVVQIASRGLTEEILPVALDDGYFETAGRVARERAAIAAYRLRDVLHDCLNAQ